MSQHRRWTAAKIHVYLETQVSTMTVHCLGGLQIGCHILLLISMSWFCAGVLPRTQFCWALWQLYAWILGGVPFVVLKTSRLSSFAIGPNQGGFRSVVFGARPWLGGAVMSIQRCWSGAFSDNAEFIDCTVRMMKSQLQDRLEIRRACRYASGDEALADLSRSI